MNPNTPALTDAEAEARFRSHPASADTIENWTTEGYGGIPPKDHFRWGEHWRRIPYETLALVFSFDEIIRFWTDEFIMNSAGEHIEKEEQLLWKLRNQAWRYGSTVSFDLLASILEGVRALRCDLPGFDVRLTTTSAFNEFGPSVHMRETYEGPSPNLLPGQKALYLDGPLGLLLYYKGVHVLTVGFAVSSHGVLVSQVQLRHKKGNRFLYHLPCGYLDFALGLLARAFPTLPMHLVTGRSTTTAIRAAYTKDYPCTMTSEVEARIVAFYDQRLGDYTRTTSRLGYYGRTFVKLTPRRATATVSNDLATVGA